MNVHKVIKNKAEPFINIESAQLDGLLNRIGDIRIVMLGETTHGTSEFYQMRAHITRALIEKKGFNLIAIEWDYPDVEIVDRYIRNLAIKHTVFNRFPTWLYRNQDFFTFLNWLNDWNARSNQVRMYGIDLYGLGPAIERVWEVLGENELTRRAYEGLYVWRENLAHYGLAIQNGLCPSYEQNVLELFELVSTQPPNLPPEELFHLLMTLRMILGAEQALCTTDFRSHWNRRAQYMGDTIEKLLTYHGDESKIVVWAHNSHVGNVDATHYKGQQNIGQRFEGRSYRVGFGFYSGRFVSAASWGGPFQIQEIAPPQEGKDTYERLFHETELASFFLPLKQAEVYQALLNPRLHRAIGTIYKQESEHYIYTSLPNLFDEYVWFNRMEAVKPL